MYQYIVAIQYRGHSGYPFHFRLGMDMLAFVSGRGCFRWLLPGYKSVLLGGGFLRREEYTRKWSITYKGKPFRDIYGKKKAYDLLYELSKHIDNLEVEASDKEKPAPRAKRKPYNNRKRFQEEKGRSAQFR